MRAATMSLGLCLWGAACSPAPATTGAPAPAPAPDGVVGLVAAVKGTAWIEGTEGSRSRAEEGGLVRRSDRLSPDPDAFVVVLLKNKRVMKISAPTPVAKIAVLDAPESEADLEAMLRSQLGTEYSGVIDDQKLQRIAGWSQRMAAGESVAPTRISTPAPGAATSEVKADSKQIGVSDGPAKEEKPHPLDDDLKKGTGRVSGGLSADPVTNRVDNVAPPNSWIFQAKGGDDGEPVERQGLPRPLALAWGALGECLRGASELRVEVAGGKITAVTPAGCSEALVGEAVAELREPGTIVVKLR